MHILKKNKYEIIAAFTSFFLSFLFVLRSAEYFKTINITISQLALPVMLSGLKWDYLIANSEFYGYGLKWLLTPLFIYIDNPYYVYLASIVMYAILIAIFAMFFYKFANKYWGLNDNLGAALLVAFVFRIRDASDSYSCEVHVLISVFVVCMVITRLLADLSKNTILSLFLAFWLCFSRTLHERTLALSIGFFIFAFIIFVIYKKVFINLYVFVPAYLVFFFAERWITRFYKSILFSERVVDKTLKNTSAFSGIGLWFLDSLNNFHILLDELLGNVITLTIHSYGTFLIVLIACIYMLIEMLLKRRKGLEIAIENENTTLFAISLFALITTGIIIMGLGINYGGGISAGTYYQYKGYGYYRYFLPFFQPAFICFWIVSSRVNLKDVYKVIPCATCLGIIITICSVGIINKLADVEKINNKIHLERMGLLEYITSIGTKDSVLISVAVVFLVYALIILYLRKQKGKGYALIIFFMIMIDVVSITDAGKHVSFPDFRKDDYYELFEMFNNDEVKNSLSATLYVAGSSFTQKKTQLLLQEYEVIPYDEDNIDNNSIKIVLSYSNSKGRYYEQWNNIKLENGMYIFYKDIDLKQLVMGDQ